MGRLGSTPALACPRCLRWLLLQHADGRRRCLWSWETWRTNRAGCCRGRCHRGCVMCCCTHWAEARPQRALGTGRPQMHTAPCGPVLLGLCCCCQPTVAPARCRCCCRQGTLAVGLPRVPQRPTAAASRSVLTSGLLLLQGRGCPAQSIIPPAGSCSMPLAVLALLCCPFHLWLLLTRLRCCPAQCCCHLVGMRFQPRWLLTHLLGLRHWQWTLPLCRLHQQSPVIDGLHDPSTAALVAVDEAAVVLLLVQHWRAQRLAMLLLLVDGLRPVGAGNTHDVSICTHTPNTVQQAVDLEVYCMCAAAAACSATAADFHSAHRAVLRLKPTCLSPPVAGSPSPATCSRIRFEHQPTATTAAEAFCPQVAAWGLTC